MGEEEATATSRVATAVRVLLTRSLLTKLLGFGAGLISYRLLGPSDFGEAALALVGLTLAGFLLDSGLGAAFIRRKESPTTEELRALSSLQLALATVLLTTAAASSVLGRPGQLAAVMALSLPLLAVRAPAIISLERRLDFRPLAQLEVVELVAYHVLVLAGLLLGFGVWALAAAQVLKSLLGTAYLLRGHAADVVRPTRHWSPLAPVWRFGLRFQALHATTLVREQAFSIALASLGGTAVLGLWSFVQRILLLPLTLLETLWRVSYPAMSAHLAAGREAGPAVQRASRLCALILSWLLVPLIVVSPGLVPVAFGDEWSPAVAGIVAASAALVVLGPISTAGLAALMTQDLAASVVRAVVASGLVSVLLLLLFGTSHGLVLVGVATATGSLVEALLLELLVRRRFGVSGLLPTVPSVVAAVVAAGAGLLTSAALDDSVVGSVVALVVALVVLGTSGLTLERRAVVDARGLMRPKAIA